jgi:hypothetical protein
MQIDAKASCGLAMMTPRVRKNRFYRSRPKAADGSIAARRSSGALPFGKVLGARAAKTVLLDITRVNPVRIIFELLVSRCLPQQVEHWNPIS